MTSPPPRLPETLIPATSKVAAPLVVAAAILDSLVNPSRLLAARRSAPEQLAGMWEFPGGKVEKGENPEAGLLRELREELGISVLLGSELIAPEAAGWPLKGAARMRLWFAEVSQGTPEPLQDHDELRWLSLPQVSSASAGQMMAASVNELVADEIAELPWIPADVPILHALIRELSIHGSGLRQELRQK